MAIRQSKTALARIPALSMNEASDNVGLVFEYVTTTLAAMAVTDIIEMGALPAGCVLVAQPVLVCDDIDTGITLSMNVGLMDGQYLYALNDAGAARSCGSEFFSATTIGQTGGVVTGTLATAMLLAPGTVERSIGIRIAAAATGVTAGARIRLHMIVAPAPVGLTFV